MKILKNQSGFSMTDTVVASALLGMAIVGAVKLSDLQQGAVSSSGVDLTRYSSLLTEYITDPSACALNFKGKPVDKQLELPFLVNSKGVQITKVGDAVEKGSYKIDSIVISGYRPSAQRTTVTVTFSALKKLPGQNPMKKSHINLFTKIDPDTNLISECIDPFGLSTEELIDHLCYDADPNRMGNCNKNFNGVVDQVKQKYCQEYSPFLAYNEASKKCYPLDANKECESGFIKGYSKTGPICYTPPNVTPPVPKANCTVAADQLIWGRKGTSSCRNFSAINLKEGEVMMVAGGQPFIHPHESNPDPGHLQPEMEGEAEVKCLPGGVVEIIGTPVCKQNCIVNTLNHHFPAANVLPFQCKTKTRNGTLPVIYKFGDMDAFVRIRNNSSLKLKGQQSETYITPFCDADGVMKWTGVPYHCTDPSLPEN